MPQSNWDRIQDIYHAALALPQAERLEFVEKECAGNPELLREIISLLEVGDITGVLKDPVFKFTSDNLVGTKVDGRYLIERELPHGGMGQVYVARHLELPGKLVVIKILIPTSANDPDALKRFKREVAALTLIDHPNVVSVLGADELPDGKPYIVMQYIDGLTLRSEISRERMDVKRAASLIKQIGAAVSHAHDKGVLHLDLKPENIMLQLLSDGTEVVKIVDFGIAKIKNSVGATSTLNTVPIGTVAYMSPEQSQRGERLTAASDVYSMAVVACEMITGERPVQAAPASLKPIALPTSLSAKARKIIARALSFEAKDRYQSAKQFGDDLAEALLNDKQNGLKDLSLRRPLKKRLTVAGGVLVLALLSYGIFWYLTRRVEPPPTHGFNYWLMVQRMRGDEAYDAAVKSNGNDTFYSGDKFQLNVLSLEPGYLYIFNEGPPEPNNISFRAIYPNKAINDNSASIGANHTFQSDWNPFRGPPGTSNFWIVWSASPVSELEFAKNEAAKHPQAGLTDHNLVRVKNFLLTGKNELDVRTRRFEARQEVTVRSNNEIVITLAQFKHR